MTAAEVPFSEFCLIQKKEVEFYKHRRINECIETNSKSLNHGDDMHKSRYNQCDLCIKQEQYEAFMVIITYT